MVDIAAAMTRKIATAFKDIAPNYADWLNICADAKKENERLRETLRLIERHPVEQSQEWEVAVQEIKRLASAALKDKEQ